MAVRDEAAAAALARLPGWQQTPDGIRRTIPRADFADAMKLVRRVADLARATGCAPEIRVHGGAVTIVLAAPGGITEAHLEFARLLG